MNDTRGRILEVALDLFIERGYDKTSLREIAERVGVTKAALYYHFSSKEEIIRTLMLPVYEHVQPLTAALARRPNLKEWGEGLAAIVEWVLPQRRLFELFENNQGILQTLAADWIDPATHEAIHDAMDAMFSDETRSLAERLRMAGSLGVIAGVLGGPAGKLFWRVPADELRPLLMDAINDVLAIS